MRGTALIRATSYCHTIAISLVFWYLLFENLNLNSKTLFRCVKHSKKRVSYGTFLSEYYFQNHYRILLLHNFHLTTIAIVIVVVYK